ncbi:iron-sulfur cluster carrier protein ApbC [Marinicella sp. S1101]|uniref:iron-sulfur cluster carrier protein ApbC n=1 Tax=Marinicella marina TaxID=2996016 RepID=UPI0022608DB1|nr:iron-sulfur cluster carrier protein ApbC [Marinicella marina]MCX7554971.1 iron-sulfur cluster carrier protein ApbC [Marinicella marina]MDJ1141581.1 iron-sulfur cluster carrier protein ApbC [Marinicella marina]
MTQLTEQTDPITQQLFDKSIDFKSSKKRIEFRYPIGAFEQDYQKQLAALIDTADLNIKQNIRQHAVKDKIKPIKGIKNIIAVASGKGGVGKSTMSVMLAKSLQQLGASVGILDADIYGPSIPKMLGVSQKPESPDQKSFLPVDADGLQTMSLGYILGEKDPAIWRGAMVTKALMQMIEDTRWSQLDYLIMDLPPGTGDIQLTMIQKIPVTAAVLVTTPQDIALLDAQKALAMFQKVDIPVLGVIENMSTYICENCGHEAHIFGQDGGAKMAAEFDVPMLGQMPLNIDIRTNMDSGHPSAVWQASHPLNEKALMIALRTGQNLAKCPIKFSLTDSLKLHKI